MLPGARSVAIPSLVGCLQGGVVGTARLPITFIVSLIVNLIESSTEDSDEVDDEAYD